MSLFHALLADGASSPLTVTLSSNLAVIEDLYFNVEVVFSEEVVELVAGDFSISNGTIGNIYTEDNITFVVAVFPDFNGTLTVSIPAGNVTATAGGTNLVSNTLSYVTGSDYVTNMLDEWYANRNVRLNLLGTSISEWRGARNNTQTSQVGTILPSSETIGFSGTAYLQAGNITPLGWAGDLSIFVRVPAAGAFTQAAEYFYHSTGGDDIRVIARRSDSAPYVSVWINSVNYDSAQSWPVDGNAHNLGWVIDFANGNWKFYMDGTLMETIAIPVTSGIDYTTTTGSPTIGRFSSTLFFSQDLSKIRIYKEAVSQTNAEIITSPLNQFATFFPADTTPSLVVIFGGESIMRGHTATMGDFPAVYNDTFDDIKVWRNSDGFFDSFTPGTTPVTFCGPFISALYDLRVKYPNKNIFSLISGSAGSTLNATPSAANSWNSTTGTLYSNMDTNVTRLLQTLIDVEGRNIEAIVMCMAQGINDCDDLTRANNYQTNLETWLTDARADFARGGEALLKVIWNGPHDQLPVGTYPYTSTVRTAVSTVDGADANFYSILTDDDTLYPKNADDIHLLPTGTINLGKAFTDLV